MSVQLESRLHLYRSIIHRVSLSWGRTPIDRPSSYQFEFILSFRDHTFIDRPFFYPFELRPHLYWSTIFLSVWVWVFRVGTAPISIDHLSIISSSIYVFGTAPISIGHFLMSVRVGAAPILIGHVPIIFHVSLNFWDRIYIDRSFVMSVWVGVAPISISHLPC